MSDLADKIKIAAELKPKFGEPCNYCGWCCMTEVCSAGQYVLGSEKIPCSLLKWVNGKDYGRQYCSLALGIYRKMIGIGTGCDSETQDERLEFLRRSYAPNSSI